MARILLVEDNEMNRDMLSRRLERKGHQVTNAADGQPALNLAAALRPDLILMDVVMPEMNGFEAVKWLRQRDTTRSVPIVMVTTQAEAESMEAGYESGCSDYIIKPIDSTELLTKVRSILGD